MFLIYNGVKSYFQGECSMKKKFLIAFVSMLFAAALFSGISAHAAEIVDSGFCGAEGDGTNLTWTLDSEGTLTVTGNGEMGKYIDWWESYSPWYGLRASIKKAVINEGVSSIEVYAFFKCGNLTSIAIPESVTSIGDSAFNGCNSLTSITIPESVTSIGFAAFRDCSSLFSITIPSSVSYINTSAFSGCSNLTSITIPSSVTNIGIGAFANCSSLTSVTISEGVKHIENSAFSGCGNLTSVNIPSSMEGIQESAFKDCKKLTDIVIPDSVTYIGREAFDNTGWYNTQPNGVVYAGNCLYKYKGEMPFGTEITVKPGTFSICRDAFWGCKNLTSVTIPPNVDIGVASFSNCNGLTSVIIPEGTARIEMQAFYRCSNLTSVTIPVSVTSIASYAFAESDNLREIRYAGTKTQWNSIDFTSGNDNLKNIKVIYNYTPPLPVLSTDIRSYVFGSEIESYNVNGSTCIVAEDLMNYGFTVVWDGVARTLSITHPSDDFTQAEKKNFGAKSGSIGEKLTETVPTDIVTYVNGEEVQSYNIGGKTVIYIDALGVFGGVTWDGDARTISVG